MDIPSDYIGVVAMGWGCLESAKSHLLLVKNQCVHLNLWLCSPSKLRMLCKLGNIRIKCTNELNRTPPHTPHYVDVFSLNLLY